MAYSKTSWVNGTTPAISADNLNKIEQGIKDIDVNTSNAFDNNKVMSATWEQGGYSNIINYSNPQPSVSTKRIRTEISLTINKSIKIVDKSGNFQYTYALFVGSTRIGGTASWTDTTNEFSFDYSNNAMLRLCFRDKNETNIVPSDAEYSDIYIYIDDDVFTFSDIANGFSQVEQKIKEINKSLEVVQENFSFVDYSTSKTWYQGGYKNIYNYSTPEPTAATNRVRSEFSLSSYGNYICIRRFKTGFDYTYAIFDENGTRISGASAWKSDDTVIETSDPVTVRIAIRKSTDSSIVVQEVANSGIAVTSSNKYENQVANFNKSDSNPVLNTLKLCTFNVGLWGYGTQSGMNDDLVPEKLKNWRSFLGKNDIDFLAIQEFDSKLDKSDTLDALTYLLNNNFKSFVAQYPQQLRIFSKMLSMKNTTTGNLGEDDPSTQRGYVKTYISFNGIDIALYNVHLYYGNDAASATIRATQIAELITLMDDDPYVIVFGDFNTNQGTEEFEPFTEAGYILTNGSWFGFDYTYNWDQQYPSETGNEVLDNIIVSSNIKVVNMEVPNTYNDLTSDHLPVITSIYFAQ